MLSQIIQKHSWPKVLNPVSKTSLIKKSIGSNPFRYDLRLDWSSACFVLWKFHFVLCFHKFSSICVKMSSIAEKYLATYGSFHLHCPKYSHSIISNIQFPFLKNTTTLMTQFGLVDEDRNKRKKILMPCSFNILWIRLTVICLQRETEIYFRNKEEREKIAEISKYRTLYV